MRPGEERQASGRERALRPLLAALLRWYAAALLAACAAVTASLGVLVAGQYRPVWLDSAVDARVAAALGRFHAPLSWLTSLGTLKPTALMTAALVLACAAVRRWTGAILAAVAIPLASGLTEYVLKPLVNRQDDGNLYFPSGHATTMFALAATCVILLADPLRHRVPGIVRSLLALVALLVAVAVPAATIAIGVHFFTDAVAGAAVGTGVVLAVALALDWATTRLYRHQPTGAQVPGAHRAGRP